MRTPRGLTFNASYACTGMHESTSGLFLISNSISNNAYHTVITTTNSTRGFSLSGLTHLGYRWRREASEVEDKKQAEQAMMHVCVCSNQASPPLIIVQSPNLSLYSMFALQHG